MGQGLLLRDRLGIEFLDGDKLHCVSLALYILFISIIFFSSFAVILNCLYLNPQVLPFPSDSPLHPTG